MNSLHCSVLFRVVVALSALALLSAACSASGDEPASEISAPVGGGDQEPPTDTSTGAPEDGGDGGDGGDDLAASGRPGAYSEDVDCSAAGTDTMYLISTDEGLTRVSQDGAVMWVQPEAGGPVNQSNDRQTLEPQTDDHYVRDDGRVIDLATNIVYGEDLLLRGPILDDCTQLFNTRDALVLLEANGHIRWTGPNIAKILGVVDNMVVALKDRELPITIMTFNLDDGALVWEGELIGDSAGLAGPTVETFQNGVDYFHDPTNGELLFERTAEEAQGTFDRRCGNADWRQLSRERVAAGLTVLDSLSGEVLYRDERSTGVKLFENSALIVRDADELVLVPDCTDPATFVAVRNGVAHLLRESAESDSFLAVLTSSGLLVVDKVTGELLRERGPNIVPVVAAGESLVVRGADRGDVNLRLVDIESGAETLLPRGVMNTVGLPRHLTRPILWAFHSDGNGRQTYIDAVTGDLLALDEAVRADVDQPEPTSPPATGGAATAVLAPGIVSIEADDDWCVIDGKLTQNYGVLGPLPANDPARREASFTQTLDSVRTAAALAPEEIAEDMARVTQSWAEVIRIHEDAGWDLTRLNTSDIAAAQAPNLDAFEAVIAYSESNCS